MDKKNKENEQWKLLISNLQEKAIAKLGTGWQTKLAKITSFSQPGISRMFSLKSPPNLKNYLIVMEVIERL
ncbi:MAG: hypothetical protein ACWIPI_00715 [Polaribacter sp.]